jgi:DHA1 family multidrug/chloramphenicol efflux transport protein-like MFS transporter
MSQFIMARFFQGMGLCFIGVVGYAVLQEMFEEMDAVRLISLMGNITVVAPLIGPLLGAIIIHYLHWRDIFYIIAVFACLAVFGLWRFMPETVGVNKRDGTQTPIAPLHLLQILKNYRELLVNRRFVFGALSLGVGTIPIIAWIGTSPLILMQGAHFSVIEYGLWQLPIFVSASLGNIVMRFSTYRMALQRIATIGAMVLLLGLALVSLLPSLLPLSYLGVIIGISIYAFGLGFMTAPLNRLTLFSTMIPKGTASALISVILMLCTGVGNQLVGLVYVSENNTYFGLFCGACGLIFLLSYRAMIGKLSELLAA